MENANEPSFVLHPPLEVSPYDQLQYRAVTLPNSLDVLIASDPSSDKAAASLDLGVGSFCDPENLPGLAHFLEHMLFLGTKKYPDEDSYHKFLAENGGRGNAYTSHEHTNFHFEIIITEKSCHEVDGKMPPFKEALDRFSQFFKAPLFTESATERELKAVHSEHQKNLQSDTRRKFQVSAALSNPKHPQSKFSTGSMESLRDIPKEIGIDTRAALLEFHRTYYSANLMKLCISGPHSLDILQEWVCDLFSGIPNSQRENPCEVYRSIPPLREEDRGRICMVESIKDIRHLELTWTTPEYATDIHARPGTYIADLLGDEGEGSILSLLKKWGWCDSLSSGLMEWNTYNIMSVQATLTTEGIDHIDEIISVIYQYVRLIKKNGISLSRYEEESTLARNSFTFHEKIEPFQFVVNTSGSMHDLPPEEYISGLFLYKEYREDLIRKVLDYITPTNGNILVAGKFVSEKTVMKEKWYGTPYFVEDVPTEKLEKWNSTPCHPDLHLPEQNPFIPTKFDLLATPLPDGTKDIKGPKLASKTDFMEVYHKLDKSFKRPKACMIFLIRTPVSYCSPLHVVLTHLLAFLIEDALMEYSYPAHRAGFHYQVDQLSNGLQIFLKGYSHRIDVLLKAVLDKIASLDIDPVRFAMQKDSLQRSYQNFAKTQPYSLAMYNSSCMLEEPRWHVNDCLDALLDGRVTIERLKRHAEDIRSRAFVTALITGNVLEDSAIAMTKVVHSVFKYTPANYYENIQRRIVQLPPRKEFFFRMGHTNSEDNNSAIEVLFQIGLEGDRKRDVVLDLISEILNKPCFHELRTIQQLGYLVFEGMRQFENLKVLYVIIQSTVANPDDLLERIDKFLASARADVLECMTEENFEQYRGALQATKSQPDTSLSNQTWRFWQEIVGDTLDFERKFEEVETLKSITKQDILEFYDRFIASQAKERRRIISQVYGNNHPLDEKREIPGFACEVRDPYAFRRSFPLYPVDGVHAFQENKNVTSN